MRISDLLCEKCCKFRHAMNDGSLNEYTWGEMLDLTSHNAMNSLITAKMIHSNMEVEGNGCSECKSKLERYMYALSNSQN